MSSTFAAVSASLVARMFRSPTLMPVPFTSWPNMLAPPAIFASTRAFEAMPSARISASMIGTIVSGNFAGFDVSRDIGQDVGNADEMVRSGRRRGRERVAPLEASHSAHFGRDGERRLGREVASSKLPRRLAEITLLERAAVRRRQRPGVDVASQH